MIIRLMCDVFLRETQNRTIQKKNSLEAWREVTGMDNREMVMMMRR